MQKLTLTLVSSLFFLMSLCQTIGGNSVYNFLKLPNAPQVSGLGGINISGISNDIGMSFNNPALLRPEMHGQLTTVFNSMYAGIKNYHVMLGYRNERLQTNFALGIHYLNYGAIPQTDAAGNVLGSFRPGDYVVQLTASRTYMTRWHYGTNIKFINSNYGLYRSSGIALDAGVAWYDSSKMFQVALVMKNMGVQLRKYQGTMGDDLPFDIELGVSKKLSKAPIQFSITAHHLHQFDLLYEDTSFNNDNGITGERKNSSLTFDKVFHHLIFATQFFIGDKVEITTAYNHLRRSELNISNSTNGLNGFSLGLGILFRKLQIRYSRAYYQNNTAYNQFGLNMPLNEYFGLGNFGQRVGW